jgi:hypothetical protein
MYVALWLGGSGWRGRGRAYAFLGINCLSTLCLGVAQRAVGLGVTCIGWESASWEPFPDLARQMQNSPCADARHCQVWLLIEALRGALVAPAPACNSFSSTCCSPAQTHTLTPAPCTPPPPTPPPCTHPLQVLRMSEALRWSPVASDTKSWLEAIDQLTHSAVNVTLAALPFEPYSTCNRDSGASLTAAAAAMSWCIVLAALPLVTPVHQLPHHSCRHHCRGHHHHTSSAIVQALTN